MEMTHKTTTMTHQTKGFVIIAFTFLKNGIGKLQRGKLSSSTRGFGRLCNKTLQTDAKFANN